MRINNNISSMNTYRQLSINQANGAKSMEKLSSGLRINRAADDAAGLAISEKMRAQIRGLDQAQRNAQDGISMIQTAEGAMDVQHNILQRMRELAVQASNGSSTTEDKKNIQEEINNLISEVDRVAKTSEFNNTKLLDGNLSKSSRTSTFGTSNGLNAVTVDSDVKVGDWTVDTGAQLAADTETRVATKNVLQQADGSTAMTDATAATTNLTDMKMGGSSLGLAVGDEITISAVVGGETKSAVFVVKSDSKVSDLMKTIEQTFDATVSFATAGQTFTDAGAQAGTADTAAGELLIVGNNVGANMAIEDVSISAKSSNGSVRTDFNTAIGTEEIQVAGDNKDYIVSITDPGSTKTEYVATRENTTVKEAGIELSFGATITASTSETVKVGTQDKSATFQIGANEGQNLKLEITDMGAEALKLSNDGVNISVLTTQDAAKSITVINNAINTVSTERAKLGAVQNRLEYTAKNLGTTSENMTAAESRIRDVDMAKEVMTNSKNNILAQAAQAMLAQANQAPQGVLQLLR